MGVKRIVDVLPEDLGLFDALAVEEHLHLTGAVYGFRAPKRRRGPTGCSACSIWNTAGTPSPRTARTGCGR